MRPGQPLSPLRRDARLANINAALWATGAGLAPTLLVVFLAMDYQAHGLQISWVLAAPRFSGVLRLFVPGVIHHAGSCKRVCLCAYIASGVALVLLPLLSAPFGMSSPNGRLAALTICWGLYQVLEYFGTTALWAWLGDLYPKRIRGRLIGQRERYLVSGQLVGMANSFALTFGWLSFFPNAPRWAPMAVSAALGGLLMLAAIVPLLRMRDLKTRVPRHRADSWSAMAAALTDHRFARLLLWSMALSVANGISAASRAYFQRAVLGFEYSHVLAMRATMRGGQFLIAPAAGRWVDRAGGPRVLLWSQAIVATSPLFYLLASHGTPWWLIGAYLAWIAFGAMNVGLDTMKLNLAPSANFAPALSVYYAASDLTSGLTILAGGLLLGRIIELGAGVGSHYTAVLLLSFALRMLVGLLVLWLPKESAGDSPPQAARP